MLVFVLNQAQKANTGKIQTPVYENVREFGEKIAPISGRFFTGYRFASSRSDSCKEPCRRSRIFPTKNL